MAEPPPEVPADVNIPDLTIESGWPKPLTGGDVPINFSQGATPHVEPPPSVSQYKILPSSLVDAQKSIMVALKLAVDDWADLKAYIDRVKHFIYYRPEEVDPGDHQRPSQEAMDRVNLLDNAMLASGDGIATVGALIEHLDGSAQAYVNADTNSYFPPA